MHWQDIIVTIGSAMLLGSLVPMLSAQSKPPFWTSVASAAVLFAFALVYLSLWLWFSAAVTLLSSIGWAILAWQWKIKRRKLDKAIADVEKRWVRVLIDHRMGDDSAE